MKQKSILLFPSLTLELQEAIGYKSAAPEFSYIREENQVSLSLMNQEGTDHTFTALLRDENTIWNPDEYETSVVKSISLKSIRQLFGPDGIAPASAEIGVAVMWIDAKAVQRGSVSIGSFSARSRKLDFKFSHVFRRGTLRGTLILQTVLYLKSVGTVESNEKHLAHNTGSVFGILDEYQLIIDGNGSIFPIVIKDEPDGLLWSVRYDEGTDPMTDSFDEENVCIYLNRAHPLYNLIDGETPIKDNPLLVEILTTALLVICNTAKEEIGDNWNSVITGGTEFDEGSIAQAMSYFRNKLMWDFTNQVTLSESIRAFFEKQLQRKAK